MHCRREAAGVNRLGTSLLRAGSVSRQASFSRGTGTVSWRVYRVARSFLVGLPSFGALTGLGVVLFSVGVPFFGALNGSRRGPFLGGGTLFRRA